MTSLAQRNPQAFGILVTLAGVMIFIPDALIMRLIGGDMLALAFWRGLLAGGVFLLGNRILAPQTMPAKGEWFDRKGLLIIGLNAGGVLSWCSAMQYTSAANALLVLAIAPFLAAILSFFFLRERIDRATALAIALVFTGVLIIGSGSLGHGRLLGDGAALINALTIAAYYVTLRTTGTNAGSRSATKRCATGGTGSVRCLLRTSGGRERAMLPFRRMRTLQKFASVHAAVHNHFPTERHLLNREHFKQSCAAALAEWCGLLAA
jgi:drug/metabolite transporter (DMT)-like permease